MSHTRQKLLARTGLALLIIGATWPSWRLLVLGSAPTDNELLQLRCGSATQDSASARLRGATHPRP
jgi:hypothetical protein